MCSSMLAPRVRENSFMRFRILLLLSIASGALAQDAPPIKLTLRDAIGLALKQNPQVILANLGVAQSEQDRAIARSGLLPQVNARASEGSTASTWKRLSVSASPDSPSTLDRI